MTKDDTIWMLARTVLTWRSRRWWINTQSEDVSHDRAPTLRQAQSGRAYSWDNLLAPIEALEDELAQAWSPVSHLNSVLNSEELRAAYNACLPLFSDYGTWKGQHEALFAAYQHIAEREDFAQLGQARRKAVEDALRDFRLAGVGLPDADKARYGELQQRLSELGSKFGENVLDATNAWSKQVGAQQLDGLPETALASARQAAEESHAGAGQKAFAYQRGRVGAQWSSGGEAG